MVHPGKTERDGLKPGIRKTAKARKSRVGSNSFNNKQNG
jgi:hypothetical protein